MCLGICSSPPWGPTGALGSSFFSSLHQLLGRALNSWPCCAVGALEPGGCGAVLGDWWQSRGWLCKPCPCLCLHLIRAVSLLRGLGCPHRLRALCVPPSCAARSFTGGCWRTDRQTDAVPLCRQICLFMQLEREMGCGLGLALGEVRAARQPCAPSSRRARCRPAGVGVVSLRMLVPEESCGGCAAGDANAQRRSFAVVLSRSCAGVAGGGSRGRSCRCLQSPGRADRCPPSILSAVAF